MVVVSVNKVIAAVGLGGGVAVGKSDGNNVSTTNLLVLGIPVFLLISILVFFSICTSLRPSHIHNKN